MLDFAAFRASFDVRKGCVLPYIAYNDWEIKVSRNRFRCFFVVFFYVKKVFPMGGTPLYRLYRYVRPQRVWFFSHFGHELGIEFSHFCHHFGHK